MKKATLLFTFILSLFIGALFGFYFNEARANRNSNIRLVKFDVDGRQILIIGGEWLNFGNEERAADTIRIAPIVNFSDSGTDGD